MIWRELPTPEALNVAVRGTMVEHVGIVFTEVGDDFLVATMPVDARTTQPAGLLHGGASACLAESMGSLAAALCVDLSRVNVVGLEINANHVRGVRAGMTVIGTARPLHLGRSTQLWDIRIADEQGRLVCVSRLTVALLPVPGAPSA